MPRNDAWSTLRAWLQEQQTKTAEGVMKGTLDFEQYRAQCKRYWAFVETERQMADIVGAPNDEGEEQT